MKTTHLTERQIKRKKQPQFICQTEAHTNDHGREDGTDGCKLLWRQIFQRRERTLQRTHLSQRCVWLPVFVLSVCVCVFVHVYARWGVHLQSCTQHQSPSSPASTEVYLGSGREHIHVYTGGLNPWSLTSAQTSHKPPGDRLISC